MPTEPGRELIYIGDPMCSWCHGFAPELEALAAAHPGLPLRVLVGGLRPSPGDPVDDRLAEMLAHHWREVAERTGRPFDHAILERRDWVYDTEPACRAVVVMRAMAPAATLAYFVRIQRAFYAEGTVLTPDALVRLAAGAGADPAAFARHLASEEAAAATRREFAVVQEWGIMGFPALVLRDGMHGTLLAAGWTPVAELERRLAGAPPPGAAP